MNERNGKSDLMLARQTIAERAVFEARRIAEMREQERLRLRDRLFDLVREHEVRIRETVERAVLAASAAGHYECTVGYDGFSLGEMKDPAPETGDIECLGPILELQAWAISEGLRMKADIEPLPSDAIGFNAMRYPRLRFFVSWSPRP